MLCPRHSLIYVQSREKQKGVTGRLRGHFFFPWVILVVAALSTQVASEIEQPHRHFTAEQLAPRAKVVRDCQLGLSVMQSPGTQTVRQQPGRALPEKQQYFE